MNKQEKNRLIIDPYTKSAQTRWHSIRTAYSQANKRVPTGSDGEASSSYMYGEELSFLRTCSAARAGHNSTLSLYDSQPPDYDDYDQFYGYPIGGTDAQQSTPPVKRKPTIGTTVLEQQDDQWTQFGKYVGAFLSQMPDKKKQRELRKKIHHLMEEYDSD
ncbi:hypothetical protein Ddc_11592 [Ditylenchus destructor]|nr:hypothetical protein Ddc_11592 [Ditylenchus destructor]